MRVWIAAGIVCALVGAAAAKPSRWRVTIDGVGACPATGQVEGATADLFLRCKGRVKRPWRGVRLRFTCGGLLQLASLLGGPGPHGVCSWVTSVFDPTNGRCSIEDGGFFRRPDPDPGCPGAITLQRRGR